METEVLRQWRVLQDDLVLSFNLKMQIGHRKEFENLAKGQALIIKRFSMGLPVSHQTAEKFSR